MVALACGCGSSDPGTGTSPVVSAPPTPGPSTLGGGGLGSPGLVAVPAAGKGGVAAGGATAPVSGGGPAIMNTAGAGIGNAGMFAAAGTTAGGTGGVGAAGQTTAGMGGNPVPPGSKMPVVPALTAECPAFRDGTITFMGLGGIRVAAGTKPGGPTAPMLFYWHGTGTFAGEYVTMASAVAQGVVAEGGVIISFQDTTGGDFTSGTLIFGAGDWVLADQLFACAVKNHNIDARRVYATGCSAGGLFSTAMAAARSTYIAAAAPNSGGWSFPTAFQNDHVPALMTIHGAPGVDVVAIDFSQSSATADASFKAKGGFVINCNHGGIHCGGGGLAPEMWEFFKAHPYGVDPKPWVGGLPAGFSSQCKIYD
jgi:hypothetical protein